MPAVSGFSVVCDRTKPFNKFSRNIIIHTLEFSFGVLRYNYKVALFKVDIQQLLGGDER